MPSRLPCTYGCYLLLHHRASLHTLLVKHLQCVVYNDFSTPFSVPDSSLSYAWGKVQLTTAVLPDAHWLVLQSYTTKACTFLLASFWAF